MEFIPDSLQERAIRDIGRYERGDGIPSTTVLNRIADALELSPDFLINGTLNDKAKASIIDEELLIQFKKIEQLPVDKKQLLKEFIDAFVFKANLQEQLA